MTREAKIGLLLGLAFIVAIAVVLRGVHDEGPAITDELGATGDEQGDEVVQPISGRVEEVLRPTQNRSRSVARERPRRGPVIVPLTGMVNQDSTNSSAEAVELPAGAVRHEQELPGRGPGSAVVVRPPSGGLDRALDKVTEPAQPEPLIAMAHEPAFARRNLWQRKPKKTTEQIYVVQEGDSLSTIALQVYGQVEGNRRVAVERIYKANREIMPNMDLVSPGQRVRIPALSGVEHAHTSVGMAPGRAPGKREATGQMYVVQENDSLWKIAARELGDGTRYPEIAKLNAERLGDENVLHPGMRLRIPRN